MEQTLTCEDCKKKRFCWESSRKYPCRNFNNMHKKSEKKVEGKKK